eukprot:m.110346 g.110346  ORF g.110346 m.110346 type:complete len:178 (-) comp10711_c1_seq6:754-1287(-)
MRRLGRHDAAAAVCMAVVSAAMIHTAVATCNIDVLGCFNASDAALQYQVPVGTITNMTHEACAAACHSRDGSYDLAGLTVSDTGDIECYCDSCTDATNCTQGKGSRVDDGLCGEVCAGDASDNCGGDGVVYEVNFWSCSDDPPPPPPPSPTPLRPSLTEVRLPWRPCACTVKVPPPK